MNGWRAPATTIATTTNATRSTTRATRWPALAALLTLLPLLAACGIPPDPAPKTINRRDVPAALRAPKNTWRIYLFQQGQLAAVNRAISVSSDRLTVLRAALEQLRRPVTATEAAEGFESEMSLAENAIEVASVEGDTVTVDLLDSDLDQDANKLGQVVLTLTELAGVTKVDFVVHGEPLSPPVVLNGNYEKVTPPVTRDQYTYVRLEETASLYFVLRGELVPVRRPIRAAADDDESVTVAASRYLTALATDGPTKLQREQGYTSYVGDLKPSMLCVTSGTSCIYQLQLDPAFNKLSTQRQALALGQILYTMESWQRGSLTAVEVIVGGSALDSVPTGNGRVTNPVEKSQFASLLGAS